MKLKIDNVEYNIYWGIPAFGKASEQLGYDSPFAILADVLDSKQGVMEVLLYHALTLGLQIKEDDRTASLPFGEMKLLEWIWEQPQEWANELFDDMFKFSTQGSTWAEKLGIDTAKITESTEKTETKKKAPAKIRGQKSKTTA